MTKICEPKPAFEELFKQSESTLLDWKKDFSPGLLHRTKSSDEWKRGKGTLLKDLASLANSEGEGPAHLIYGVDDSSTPHVVSGISKSFDDAAFQEWAQNAFDPPIRFLYSELLWEPGTKVGIFEIEHSCDYPHVVIQDIGGVIFEGQVWFRLGSKNTLAHHKELKGMFLSQTPIKINQPDGPIYQEVAKYYDTLGYQLYCKLLSNKDNSLAEGYKIACYPITRREIWVNDELVLMIKPKP